jgi:AraC-like DNA-binding protein
MDIKDIIFGYDNPAPPVSSINEHHISRIIIPIAGEQEIFYAADNTIKTRVLYPGDFFYSIKNGWAWITEKGQTIPFEIISIIFRQEYTRVIHVKNSDGPTLNRPDIFYHIPKTDNIAYLLINALNRLAFESKERLPQTKALFSSLLYEVLFELNDENQVKLSKAQRTFELIMEYINENYHLPINRETVCADLHLAPSYLSRLFRQKAGDNFSSYLKKLRLNRALYLLKYSNENICDVARKCGFSSSGYFIKSFKEVYKCTPTSYRLTNNNV